MKKPKKSTADKETVKSKGKLQSKKPKKTTDEGLRFSIKKSDRLKMIVSISEYKDKQYLDFREYYLDAKSGEFKPTPKGVSVLLENCVKVHKRLGKLIASAKDAELVVDVQ